MPKGGVVVDGVRIDTVFHNVGFTALFGIALAVILAGLFEDLWNDPKVDIVVRRVGERRVLYQEGPYRNQAVQERIAEFAGSIREVGLDEFLRVMNNHG